MKRVICAQHRAEGSYRQRDLVRECVECGKLRHEHPWVEDDSEMPEWFGLHDDIWILIDVSNSNPKSKNYLWWFESKEIALEQRRHQNEVYPGQAELRGPFRYVAKREIPSSPCGRDGEEIKVEGAAKARGGK
jgi:hypothetical protein